MKSHVVQKIGAGIILLLVTVSFIPSLAGAFDHEDGRQGKWPGRKGHHLSILGIWRNPQLMETLELSADQVKQIRKADFDYREENLRIQAPLDGLHLKMDKALSVDTVDETAVIALAEKIADIKGQLFVQKIEARLTVEKLLSAEQVKELKQYNMHSKKKDRPGRKKNRFAHDG